MKHIVYALLFPLAIFAATEELPIKQEEVIENNFIFDFYPPVYFPACAHRVTEISVMGDSIKLEDGSIWKIGLYDSSRVLNWQINDVVTITQNHRWFTSYKYRIVHQQSGCSLETNLFIGPVEKGLYTLYISHLDPMDGKVYLISGKGELTHWEISSSDQALFSKWRIGDAVIVGQNSGWDRSCESFLINVNENEGLRAKQY